MICKIITHINSNNFEPWDIKDVKRYKRESCGFVIKYKKKYFIIATLHGVRFAEEIAIEFANGKLLYLENRNVHQIYEADLAVIELTIKDIKYFSLGKESDESSVYYKKEKFSVKILKKEFAIRDDERFFSLFSPPLEKFIIEVDDDEFYETKKLRGMSGLPVLNNKNEVFGMIIENIPQTKHIILLSYKVIYRVISEIEENRCFEGFCGLYCDLMIYSDEEESKDNNYLIVSNNYDINYNNFRTKKKNLRNLKLYDAIESIDNKLIFDDKVNDDDELIPIRSYICNNFKARDSIKFKIHRQVKNLDETKVMNISIQARPFNSVYSIPSKSDSYYEYKGLIIKQLTTEYAIFLDNIKGINTINIFENCKIYENNPLPIYIIVDVVKEKIPNKEYKKIIDLKIPFKKYRDKYYCFCIKKINNKIPKTNDDIITITKKQKKYKFQLEVNDESFLLTL